MACADDRPQLRPVFADQDTIKALLGVPENTLRQLAREMKVAAHKLGDENRSKCVYLFEDVERWVRSQPAPKWVKDNGKEVAA